MKVMISGATGTIGRAIVEKLTARHEVIKIGHKVSDFRADIGSADSIQSSLKPLGRSTRLCRRQGWRNSRRLFD